MDKNANTVKIYIMGDTPVMQAMRRGTTLVDVEIVNTMAEADLIVCEDIRKIASSYNKEKTYAIISTSLKQTNQEIPKNAIVFPIGFNLPDYYALITKVSQKITGRNENQVDVKVDVIEPNAKTILVIDDTPKNIISAKKLLSGHYLTVAEGYDQAMDIFGKEKFEIVLTDLYLPMSAQTLSQEAFKLGQLVPYGFLLMCEAARNGAKYIAIVSDIGHHDDHFSAAFDHFSSFAFNIENAKVMMLHARLTDTGGKDWQNALKEITKEAR